jgi:DNA-binding GntR family transcriptional regulator
VRPGQPRTRRSARPGSETGTAETPTPVGHEDDPKRTPIYLKIAETLAERIASGTYEPTKRLPSESQLCAEFAVSPLTVRKALSILINQGLVWSEQGRGTFVRSPSLSDAVFTLDELSGRLLDEGTEIRLLSASSKKADEAVAKMLGVEAGTRVIHLRRLVLNEAKRPVIYHTEYVVHDPRRPLVESQLQMTSPHGLLESGRGRGFTRGEIKLRAVSLDDEAAQALGQAPGAPALRLEHIFRENNGRQVSWGEFFLNADLFQLETVLGPEQA